MRRLKWIGLGLLCLGAAALGVWSVNTLLQIPHLRPVNTVVVVPAGALPSPTATPYPTVTPTPLERARPSPSPPPTPTRAPVTLYFFYDANLNGTRETSEPLLENLKIQVNQQPVRRTNALRVPSSARIVLSIQGAAPNGKPLTNATLREPNEVLRLPELELRTQQQDVWIGLADGFLTSPIVPAEIATDLILKSKGNPSFHKKYFPEGWQFPFNAYVYGYRIPDGVNEGVPHLALDVWAQPGTLVHAAAGGVVSSVSSDSVTVNGMYGDLLYLHIVPGVNVGDLIQRNAVIGSVQEGELKHVHLQLNTARAQLLDAFPGVDAGYILKDFRSQEDFPYLPYFGSP